MKWLFRWPSDQRKPFIQGEYGDIYNNNDDDKSHSAQEVERAQFVCHQVMNHASKPFFTYSEFRFHCI